MDVKIGKFFKSLGSFMSGGDITWCDHDIIAGCEREVAEGGTQEQRSESLMRLSWALVHSRQPEDVLRGIAMLEASLHSSSSILQTRENLYLLAVGYYRLGKYPSSRANLDLCLEECEREIAEVGSQEQKSESLMGLFWALVHSREPRDVIHGIAMLEVCLDSSSCELQPREILYLLAVGYHGLGKYPSSLANLDLCLEIAPDFEPALTLRKVVYDQFAKDGGISKGTVATAV